MRGSIKAYPLKNGETQYSVRYYCPDPRTGKRVQKYKGGFRRKKDAHQFLTNVQYKMDTNTFVGETLITLENYLQDWIADYVKIDLKRSTQESHISKIKRHINPHLGHMRLQKLTTGQINALYVELLENGRCHMGANGETGLSVTTVRQVKKILCSALNDAVNKGLLVKNPAYASEIPKHAVESHQKADNYYTPDQLDVLLQKLKGTILEMPVKVAAATGLRRGELLGLTWDNVDTKTGKINVIRTLNDNPRAGKNKPKYHVDTPKTPNAIRQVYLPMRLVRELERYRLQHRRIVPNGEFDFVFKDPHGNPFKPGDFSRRFTDQIRKHELPYLTVHGLRHTFATMVLANGKHTIYELSKVMGHSSITITSDIYGHLVSETGKKMAATMDSLLTLSK